MTVTLVLAVWWRPGRVRVPWSWSCKPTKGIQFMQCIHFMQHEEDQAVAQDHTKLSLTRLTVTWHTWSKFNVSNLLLSILWPNTLAHTRIQSLSLHTHTRIPSLSLSLSLYTHRHTQTHRHTPFTACPVAGPPPPTRHTTHLVCVCECVCVHVCM